MVLTQHVTDVIFAYWAGGSHFTDIDLNSVVLINFYNFFLTFYATNFQKTSKCTDVFNVTLAGLVS